MFAESQHLPKIGRAVERWAFQACVEHFAYRLPKGLTTCMDCGHTWTMATATEQCSCPRCRARLAVRTTRERKLRQRHYFNVLRTQGDYQVLRMFLLVSEMEKGCKARTHITEIGQYWWDDRGRQAVVGVQRTLGRYVDSFAFCSPMAIRRDNEAYRYVAQSTLYPELSLTETLRRNGLAETLHDIAPALLIPALLTDSRAETLLKLGRTEHLRYFLSSKAKDLSKYWQAYKVTLRRGYAIADISLWCDYIDMLRRLGRDTHNAHFVCPEDLHQAHDNAQQTLQAQRAKEVEAQRRQKALADEERFQALKAPFFGIAFTDGTIEVRVLESVQEYFEEGKELHHCVFTNEYYLKEHSLILSARIGGKRIETIEVSLETMEVIQCRGLLNKNTEYHEQILRLVDAHTHLICERLRAVA